MKAIVYSSGGDVYHGGSFEAKPAAYWKGWGVEHGQEGRMYVGHRYYNGQREQVVVFDDELWGGAELARRKANGFLGIRSFDIGQPTSRGNPRAGHTPGPWETGAVMTRVEVWPEGWNVPV